MSNQNFKNNFNEFESHRFDLGIAMIMSLVSKDRAKIIERKLQEQLIEVEITEHLNNGGVVAGVLTNLSELKIDESKLFYPKYDSTNPIKSYQLMLHEMAHFISKPTEEVIQKEIELESDKTTFLATEMYDFSNGKRYGSCFAECGADLIADMAIRKSPKLVAMNTKIQSADDLIYSNESYSNSWYKPMQSIARLMTLTMDNTLGEESYNEMLNDEKGLLDRKVNRKNRETGKIEEIYANDYLYALTGDGLHLEMEFDKYSKNGTYEDMCLSLDNEMKKKIENSEYHIDKDIIKEQMLKMADMFNNKLYLLQNNKSITEEQKEQAVGRFNTVFNQSLQQYGISALSQEDVEKTKVSMMNSYNKLLEEQNQSNSQNHFIDELKQSVNDRPSYTISNTLNQSRQERNGISDGR